MITIELNTEAGPFFALPGGKLHLSLANPGPIEVKAETLNEQDRTIINNAHALQKIFVKKSADENSEPVKVEAPQQEERKADEPVVSRDRDVMLDKVKDLLKLSGKALNKVIDDTEDPVLLRLLKECEEDGKKRKNVLKRLDKKIATFESQVLEACGGADVAGKYASDPVRVNSEIVSEIEDSDFEEVEIRATSEEDFKDEE